MRQKTIKPKKGKGPVTEEALAEFRRRLSEDEHASARKEREELSPMIRDQLRPL